MVGQTDAQIGFAVRVTEMNGRVAPGVQRFADPSQPLLVRHPGGHRVGRVGPRYFKNIAPQGCHRRFRLQLRIDLGGPGGCADRSDTPGHLQAHHLLADRLHGLRADLGSGRQPLGVGPGHDVGVGTVQAQKSVAVLDHLQRFVGEPGGHVTDRLVTGLVHLQPGQLLVVVAHDHSFRSGPVGAAGQEPRQLGGADRRVDHQSAARLQIHTDAHQQLGVAGKQGLKGEGCAVRLGGV